jgi:hypothetical protein
MALFDQPKGGDYPKQWRDMSLEFKLMFVCHGCMMVLFITGGAFSSRQDRVHGCAFLRAHIDFHKASALGELTMAGYQTKELAHGSWRRRLDWSFPVRRDSSVPTLESKIFALVPSS